VTALAEPYRRYLRLLGIEDRPTGLDGLRLIVRRHLIRVPFENISKLLLFGREGAGRPLTLGEFLGGIEHHDLGGTCYTSNPYLADLLRALGYQADLLGADMTNPNVHTCIRVHLGPGYLVDVAFAAPFRDPVPLDALPFQIAEGSHRYAFDRHSQGIALTFQSGGDPMQSYLAHEPPRTRESFDDMVRASFLPDAYFLNRLRIARFFEDHSVDLVNRTMSIHRDGVTTKTEFARLADLEDAMRTEFAMPRCPVREAIAILDRHTGTPLFSEASPPNPPAASPRSSASA
jgi:N-hydroxyarylamine O-acetyltransferase